MKDWQRPCEKCGRAITKTTWIRTCIGCYEPNPNNANNPNQPHRKTHHPMTPDTQEAITTTRNTLNNIAAEYNQLVDHLSAILDNEPPDTTTEQIETLTAQTLVLEDALAEEESAHAATEQALAAAYARIEELESGKPPTDQIARWSLPRDQPTGILWDPADADPEIRARLGNNPELTWPDGYVDTTTGIGFGGDGSVIMHLDPAKRLDDPNTGGTNWVNCAVPLANPGTDVELRYRAHLPDDLGRSMKLPGLSTLTGDQRAPGGGYVGAGQFIARPCLSDWNVDDDAPGGPYAYWPWPATKPGNVHPANSRDLWAAATVPDGALWWLANPAAVFHGGDIVDISLRCIREDSGRWVILNQLGDHLISYDYTGHPNNPAAVTHLSFCVMYGGNSAWYGPDRPTVCRIENLEVLTRT